MTFKRSSSQRRLWGCLTAVALIFSAPGVSAAKPDDKHAPKSTAKPAIAKPGVAKKSAAKGAAKRATAKSAEKASHKPAAHQPPGHHVPMPRPRPVMMAALAPAKATLSPVAILPTMSFSPITPAAAATLPTAAPSEVTSPRPALVPAPAQIRASVFPTAPFVAAESAATPAADIALVKQAIDLVRRGRTSDATAVEKTISDTLARKLVEWTILRSDDNGAGFDRFAAFSAENPSWPGATMMRRRAESALWDEHRSDATVRAFFADSKPITAKGKFALARALLAQGDQPAAAQLARSAWREDTCSRDVERVVMETFGNILTRADYKARMDRRLYDDDGDAGLRMGHLLGGADLAIAKARNAVIEKSSHAGALLDAVPVSARQDPGYIFSKAQWLRREDKPIEAARLLQSAPHDAALLHNLDEWWIERRLVARKLLDLGENQAAYHVARDAVPPPKENFRAEHEFTAGWIALRFANNPSAAYQHFSRVGERTSNPITLARGEYWQGRAAEAAGNTSAARAHYQAAAHYPTAYYGQIARARLGLGDLVLRHPPEPANRAALMNLEVVRAARILYAIDARDLVIPFVSDLAERAVDGGALVVIAEIARKYDDARAMLLIGKSALGRGFAFDVYAFQGS